MYLNYTSICIYPDYTLYDFWVQSRKFGNELVSPNTIEYMLAII